MTARRPTDGTSLTRFTRSQEQVGKAGKLRRHFIDTTKPRIEKFVRDSYFAGMETPKQRIGRAREDAKNLREGLESEERKKEIAEDGGGKYFAEVLRNLGVVLGMQTDEEILKDLAEADEELIGESVTSCADWIWQMMINHCHKLWKSGGPQSITMADFLDQLDFFKILRGYIDGKYYPEMKEIVVSLSPELFKESHMDTTKNGYMEVAYLESSGQIVLREVSWEMLQTWANS